MRFLKCSFLAIQVISYVRIIDIWIKVSRENWRKVTGQLAQTKHFYESHSSF